MLPPRKYSIACTAGNMEAIAHLPGKTSCAIAVALSLPAILNNRGR